MKIRVRVHQEEYEVEIEDLSTQPVIARIDGESFEVWTDVDEKEGEISDKKYAAPRETKAAAAPKETLSRD
jgi:hypothetical protein